MTNNITNIATGNHFGGVPQKVRQDPKKATNRITAQNLSLMAKRLGRCGDINPVTGYVCVTQPHDSETKHAAVQIGGPADGKVYAEWV